MRLQLLLFFICQSVCLWLTAAKLHGPGKYMGLTDSLESKEQLNYTYSDDYSARQVDADDNQLATEMEMEKGRLLLADVKQRPAVQVKVTNEVESVTTMPTMMMMMRAGKRRKLKQYKKKKQQQKQQQQQQRQQLPNGNERENASTGTGTENAVPSNEEGDLMSPQGHNLANVSIGIDGQMASDEQLLRLQDYNLLYNAERQTYFQLHTSNNQPLDADDKPAEPTQNPQPPSSNGNRLLQQVVGNTLSAAFGLNTNPSKQQETMAAMTITQTVRLYDAASLRQSRYNPFNPTRIIIHGWLGNAHANLYGYLVPAYVSQGSGNYNIFTVDWGRGAIADYITASYRVKPVGLVLAKFLDFLHREAGMRFEDLQLIGFSMGAHVAGLAAKHVQTGRVRVIRALDPAQPFFRYAQEKERLTQDDADYVEVLHTSVGSYGFDRPLGHVDFYANWGSQQPGCFWHECSHWRAFALFQESLLPADVAPFDAEGCAGSEWQQLIRYKQCLQPTGLRLHMGGDLGDLSAEQLATRRGVYYFETNAKPPYDMGTAG